MTPALRALHTAEHVLMDFDGPICAVFAQVTDAEVANALRTSLAAHGHPVPRKLATTTDPFAILADVANAAADMTRLIEAELSHWERHAVIHAERTPGIAEVMRRIHESGRSVTVVSNNAASAVRTYINTAGLTQYVTGISAREPGDVGRLKPDPYLLNQAMAMQQTPPERCIMIGDSATDIDAATATSMPAIGYADTSDKVDALTDH